MVDSLRFGVNIPMTFRDSYPKLLRIAQLCDSPGSEFVLAA